MSLPNNNSEGTLTSEAEEETLEDVLIEHMKGSGFLAKLKGDIAKFVNDSAKMNGRHKYHVIPERANVQVLKHIYEYLQWVGLRNTCGLLLSESPVKIDTTEKIDRKSAPDGDFIPKLHQLFVNNEDVVNKDKDAIINRGETGTAKDINTNNLLNSLMNENHEKSPSVRKSEPQLGWFTPRTTFGSPGVKSPEVEIPSNVHKADELADIADSNTVIPIIITEGSGTDTGINKKNSFESIFLASAKSSTSVTEQEPVIPSTSSQLQAELLARNNDIKSKIKKSPATFDDLLLASSILALDKEKADVKFEASIVPPLLNPDQVSSKTFDDLFGASNSAQPTKTISAENVVRSKKRQSFALTPDNNPSLSLVGKNNSSFNTTLSPFPQSFAGDATFVLERETETDNEPSNSSREIAIDDDDIPPVQPQSILTPQKPEIDIESEDKKDNEDNNLAEEGEDERLEKSKNKSEVSQEDISTSDILSLELEEDDTQDVSIPTDSKGMESCEHDVSIH